MDLQEDSYSEKSRASLPGEGLRNYLASLEKVINDCRDSLIVATAQGKIILFSDIAESLSGYERAKIVGQDIKILMFESHRTSHDQYIAAYHETGKGKILGIGPRDLAVRHKNGYAIPVQLSISEIYWNGEKYFVALCRDIAARIDNENALREAHQKLIDSFERVQTVNAELEASKKALISRA